MIIFSDVANQSDYPFKLPKLPYDQSAFQSYFTSENFDYHYAKHHNAYVVKLNELLENHADMQSMSLEEVVLKSAKDAKMQGIFNNAAQIWNHTFYWHSMKPSGGGKPKGKLAEKIVEDFGSLDNFKKEFHNGGMTQFGSGWVWLVFNSGKLQVVKTANANCPITEGMTPILVCDVWEHAYYIDFRNKRPDYLSAFLDHLVNWEFAEENLQKLI